MKDVFCHETFLTFVISLSYTFPCNIRNKLTIKERQTTVHFVSKNGINCCNSRVAI